MHSLGVLLDEDGKWTEAEQYLVPAMEGLRKTKGVDALETLEAMASVANLYSQLEKLKEAEMLVSQAVDGFRRTRGDQDILTLRTMDSLAMLYLGQNKPVQAEQLEEDVLQRLREQVGSDSPYTLAARRQLAATYAANGRSAEAERLWRDVLQDMRRVLGNKHPDTLYTLAIIADHYMNQGKIDEVEKYAGEALEGPCRPQRQASSESSRPRFSLNRYGSQADSKKLEPVLIESVELARYRWDPDSEVTAGGNGTLGMLFFLKSEYIRAEPYCREALAFRTKDNPESQDRFWLELRLGVSLLAQKKYSEAQSRLLTAYNGIRPHEKAALAANTSDLGWIVEQIPAPRRGWQALARCVLGETPGRSRSSRPSYSISSSRPTRSQGHEPIM